MESRLTDENLYRSDLLRAKKAALNKKDADLLSSDVKSKATVGKILKGNHNVDLKTLRSIAATLEIEMHELFIFDES